MSGAALDPSLFVSEEVKPRAVTLADGSVHTFHFRDMTQKQRRVFRDVLKTDPDAAYVRLVADLLVTPEGEPALSEELAGRLKPVVLEALVFEAMEANGLTPPKKKAGDVDIDATTQAEQTAGN